MKNNLKSYTAVLAAVLLLSGAGLFISTSINDAYASSTDFQHINETTDKILFVPKGYYGSQKIDYNEYPLEVTLLEKPSFLTYKNGTLSGTFNTLGTHTVKYEIREDFGSHYTEIFTLKLIVVESSADNLITIDYQHDKSNSVRKTYAVECVSSLIYTIKDAKIGNHSPVGYFTTNVLGLTGHYAYPGGTYELDPFTSDFGLKRVSLWASDEAYISDIPYTEYSAGNQIVNTNWSHRPTTLSGVELTLLEAPNWIHVSDGLLYGVPTSAGDYSVTLKMTKPGHYDRIEIITFSIVNELVFVNSPLNGAIFAV